MTPEDRLRQAIEARTSRVEPSADALSQIEEKLMDAQRSDNRKRVLLGLGAAAAVIAVVLAALRSLPDRQREVLALRYYLDLSEAEIAATLGISSGSVKTHAHRGLAALAEQLEDLR